MLLKPFWKIVRKASRNMQHPTRLPKCRIPCADRLTNVFVAVLDIVMDMYLSSSLWLAAPPAYDSHTIERFRSKPCSNHTGVSKNQGLQYRHQNQNSRALILRTPQKWTPNSKNSHTLTLARVHVPPSAVHPPCHAGYALDLSKHSADQQTPSADQQIPSQGGRFLDSFCGLISRI